MDGVKYISTPRLQRGGGGAAIVCNTEKFSITKLPVNIPEKLEVIWALAKPKNGKAHFKSLLL